MVYVGDAIFPGGNDYPAEQAGVVSIPVRGPDKTKKVIETIIASLSRNHELGNYNMGRIVMKRLGMIMEPLAGDPLEVEGVLNPAAIRGPDGSLYLLPRFVAEGNYSRIGISKVKFNKAADPIGVDRLGIALEPKEAYEIRPDGGGCEDPRISFVEPLQQYVMPYAAFSPHGPRIAVAVSKALFQWECLGLARFVPQKGLTIVDIDDKDASVFPSAITYGSGAAEMAMLHRPLFPRTLPMDKAVSRDARTLDLDRESIWISPCAMTLGDSEPYRLPLFTSHKRLASPVNAWERLKKGAGTPPILTPHGWLIVYHGVSDLTPTNSEAHRLCYSAGIMVLSKDDPCEITFRPVEPALTPGARRRNGGCRLSDWHRPSRRYGNAKHLRCLLRHVRPPDRCCTSKPARCLIPGQARGPYPREDLTSYDVGIFLLFVTLSKWHVIRAFTTSRWHI